MRPEYKHGIYVSSPGKSEYNGSKIALSDIPAASAEQVEALQDQVTSLKLTIDEQNLRLNEQNLKLDEQNLKIQEYDSKLDEINSYVKPAESEEMSWEKFMQRLNQQLGSMSKRYVCVFNKLRAKLDDV